MLTMLFALGSVGLSAQEADAETAQNEQSSSEVTDNKKDAETESHEVEFSN